MGSLPPKQAASNAMSRCRVAAVGRRETLGWVRRFAPPKGFWPQEVACGYLGSGLPVGPYQHQTFLGLDSFGPGLPHPRASAGRAEQLIGQTMLGWSGSRATSSDSVRGGQR